MHANHLNVSVTKYSNTEQKPGSVAECKVTRATMGCVSVANSDQVVVFFWVVVYLSHCTLVC